MMFEPAEIGQSLVSLQSPLTVCGISRAFQMSARMTENRGVPGPSPVSPFNSPLDPSLFIGTRQASRIPSDERASPPTSSPRPVGTIRRSPSRRDPCPLRPAIAVVRTRPDNALAGRPMRAPAGSLRRARFRAKRACRGAFRPFQALWPDCAGSGAAGGPPAARGHGPGVSGHPAGVVEGARSSISMPSPRLNAGARTPRHHHQPDFEPLPLERRIDPGVLTATPRQEHERRRTVSDRCEGRKRKASAARSVATSECLCRYHVEKEHNSADSTLRAAAREAELDRDPRAAEAGHLGAPPRVPSRS